MSAIVAAAQRLEDRRIDAVLGRVFTRGDELRTMIIAAGRAIVDVSNRACRAMIIRDAPRTWAVHWSLWRSGYWYARASDWRIVGKGVTPRADLGLGLGPCWDAANRLWLWGTAAHDPRPCAWPRPFARGADR